MTLRLIIIFTFIWTINCSGQNAEKDIVGQWAFSKLRYTKNSKSFDSLALAVKPAFTFSSDGTFIETNITNNSKLTNSGKWKLIDGGKKVHLYNIKTDVPNSIISDHDWIIIENKKNRYLTYTYGDSVLAPETLFYKKVN